MKSDIISFPRITHDAEACDKRNEDRVIKSFLTHLVDIFANMNADDDHYDDPDEDRVRTNPTRNRKGTVQPINRSGVAENMPLNEPSIPLAIGPAVAEDQQMPVSNICGTLSDTSDFINELRGTNASLLRKLRMIQIILAILTILLFATMGGLAYGEWKYS